MKTKQVIQDLNSEELSGISYDPALLAKYPDWDSKFIGVVQRLKVHWKIWTPEEAADHLKYKNPQNRTQSDSYVRRLARDIKDNRFPPTSAIHRDTHGTLLDGQGRLAGICVANKPLLLLTVDDWPTHMEVEGTVMPTFQFFDLGRIRSNADIQGVLNRADPEHALPSSAMSSATRSLVNWISRSKSWLAVSNPQYVLISGRMAEDFAWAIEHGKKSVRDKLIGAAPQGSLIGVLGFYHRSFPDYAERFATRMFRGIGCVENDPAMALKTWSTRNRSNAGQGYMASLVAALAVRRFHDNETLPFSQIDFKMQIDAAGRYVYTRIGEQRRAAAERMGIEASTWLWNEDTDTVNYIIQMIDNEGVGMAEYPIVKPGTIASV